MKRIFFLLSAAVLLFCNAAFSQQSALFQLEHAPDTGMVIVTRNYLGIPGQPVYIYATDFFDYYGITPGGGGGGSVDVISSVADTTGLTPEQGDFFVVDGVGGDTLGVYSGSQWYYFSVGGDGNGIISALPAGDVSINASNHTLAITNMNNVLFSLDGLFTIQKNGASNMNFNAPDATIQLNGDRVALKGDTSVTLYDGANPVFSIGQLGVAFEDLDYVPFSTGDTILVLNGSFIKRMLFSDGGVNNPFGGENTLTGVVDSLYTAVTSATDRNGIYSGSGSLPGIVQVGLDGEKGINFVHKGVFSNQRSITIIDSTAFGAAGMGLSIVRNGTEQLSFGYGAYSYIQAPASDLYIFSGGSIYLSPLTSIVTGTGATSTQLPITRPTGSTKFWGHNTSGSGSYFSPSEMVITNPWGGGNTIGGVVDSAYYAITSGLNGIISALPIGNVLIHAAGHSLAIDSLSSFSLKTIQGAEVSANGEDLTITIPATSGAELDINNLKDYDGTPNYILAQSISGITRRAPYETVTGTRYLTGVEISTNEYNFSPGVDTADIIEVEASAQGIGLMGMEIPSNNKRVTIVNVGTYSFYLAVNSSQATGATIVGDRDIVIGKNQSCDLFYNGSEWMVMSRHESPQGQYRSSWVVSSVTPGDQPEAFFAGIAAGTYNAEAAKSSPVFAPASISLNNNGGTADGAYMYLGKSHANGIFTYGVHLSAEASIGFGQLANDTTYYCNWGICGNLTGNQDANNTVGFRLSTGGGGPYSIFAYSRDGSGNETETSLFTGYGSVNLQANYRVEIDADMSEARFYIDGNYKGSITSNLPASGVGCSVRVYMRKKTGTDSVTDEVFVSKLSVTANY